MQTAFRGGMATQSPGRSPEIEFACTPPPLPSLEQRMSKRRLLPTFSGAAEVHAIAEEVSSENEDRRR